MRKRSRRRTLIPQVRIVGVEKALFRLNREINKVRFATHAGLIKAGLLLLRESQRLVPVEYGNLRSSGFIAFKKTDFGEYGLPVTFHGVSQKGDLVRKFVDVPERSPNEAARLSEQHNRVTASAAKELEFFKVVVGYTAYYSVYVHELPYRHAPGKSWKFLSLAALKYRNEIVKVVKHEIWNV